MDAYRVHIFKSLIGYWTKLMDFPHPQECQPYPPAPIMDAIADSLEVAESQVQFLLSHALRNYGESGIGPFPVEITVLDL